MSESSGNLLDVRDLTVHYQRARKKWSVPALDQVSLSVGRGETVALVGESGSGKSTLGNVVLGLVRPSAGQVVFDGEDITHATPRRRRSLTREIQAVFQDPYGSLNPSRTIGQALIEPLRAHDAIGDLTEREHVAAALEQVGLAAEAWTRYPSQFSGGQRQRIAVARALILKPQLIVCDEPTSALDLSIQAQVLNLLRRLQRELALSYLFISHDLAVVRHVANRVVVLYRGRVMESGPAERIWSAPRHPYTQSLRAAVPVPDPTARRVRPDPGARPAVSATGPGTGCPFAPRCPHVIDTCHENRPPLERVGEGLVACWRAVDEELASSAATAAVRDPRRGALLRQPQLRSGAGI